MQSHPSHAPPLSIRCLYTTPQSSSFFFFNDTATTEIYTLSLHDALPIFTSAKDLAGKRVGTAGIAYQSAYLKRSEEHTSELQSHVNLVCRLLLEKKKNKQKTRPL